MRAWRKFPARSLFCFALVTILAAGGLASSQTSPSVAVQHDAQTDAGGNSSNNPSTVPAYCENLSRGKGEAAALEAVCEFALFLPRKLPNVICDEERTRYQEDELGDEVQKASITAKVRYEDGQEQYTQVTINGKPAQPAMLGSSVSWSEGEFAQDLLAVFQPQSSAEFKFTKKDVLNSTQVLIFEFKVKRKNNRLRYLQSPSGERSFPGYHGRLWIDKSNSHLIRLERTVDDVNVDFPIQRADLVIDYRDVDLADGTEFVLPAEAVNLSCPTVNPIHCWHNQLTFKHWHKFAARARVLTGEEEPPTEQPAGASSVSAKTVPLEVGEPVPMDLRRGVSITAEILNAQIAEIERRQKEAEAAAAARVGAGKVPASEPAVRAPLPAAASGPTELPGEQVPVFKTSVRLVLVPTVVRDAQGRTVDNLQRTDFRLLDERKPQLITQFSLERPGSVPEAPTGSGVVGPVQPTSPAAVRHAAYVFDDIHATFNDLMNATEAAKRHLRALLPADRAAIFSLSGSVMLDFTNDGARLNAALDHIRPHPLTATGPHPCPDVSYEQADLIQNKNDAIALAEATADALHCAFADDSKAGGPARRMAEATAAQVLIAGRSESQISVKVLREVVRGISRLPGQRSIVLVSPGFPTAEMQQELEGIIDDALRGDVIINIVDPSGLSMSDRVQYGTASGSWDVLVDLTSGTGGTFFHNRNDMDEGFQNTALPEIFYILGFSPQKLDGKLHKLQVTLQGPKN